MFNVLVYTHYIYIKVYLSLYTIHVVLLRSLMVPYSFVCDGAIMEATDMFSPDGVFFFHASPSGLLHHDAVSLY